MCDGRGKSRVTLHFSRNNDKKYLKTCIIFWEKNEAQGNPHSRVVVKYKQYAKACKLQETHKMSPKRGDSK